QLISRLLSGTGSPDLLINLAYDAAGNLVTETRYSDAAGTQQVGATTETYNAAGAVTSMQYQDAAGISIGNYVYSFDLATHLISEVDDGTTTAYAYDATGQVTGAGSDTYTYDGNG